jgi:hypothetical protein
MGEIERVKIKSVEALFFYSTSTPSAFVDGERGKY